VSTLLHLEWPPSPQAQLSCFIRKLQPTWLLCLFPFLSCYRAVNQNGLLTAPLRMTRFSQHNCLRDTWNRMHENEAYTTTQLSYVYQRRDTPRVANRHPVTDSHPPPSFFLPFFYFRWFTSYHPCKSTISSPSSCLTFPCQHPRHPHNIECFQILSPPFSVFGPTNTQADVRIS